MRFHAVTRLTPWSDLIDWYLMQPEPPYILSGEAQERLWFSGPSSLANCPAEPERPCFSDLPSRARIDDVYTRDVVMQPALNTYKTHRMLRTDEMGSWK